MQKKAIICVDDEKIVLDSLKQELKSSIDSSYTIEVAESGDEALEIFEELYEDGYVVPLIISDFIMPEMKGDALLKKVKELKPETYTIMLTGQATIEGVTNAINQAGLYRYISKPWESNDMLLTVNEALKSYDKDLELEERRIALEEANEKLTKLDKAKTYFLGLLSHELNTPLIGINGNAKLISEFTDDPDIKESATAILDSEARLRKFADLSLLITRIQTEKYDTTYYDESLNGIIEQALFSMKDKANENKVELVQKLNETDKMVKVDISLVLKVLEFVIDNAIKYSPENESIMIESKTENGKYKLKVADKGEGFSEKSLGNLFQFFASSDDLMSHSEGTGLSLAAAKVIMEMHNFEISACNSESGGAIVEMVF